MGHRAPPLELLRTAIDCADVWSLLCVLSHVHLQIIAALKDLTTCLNLARKAIHDLAAGVECSQGIHLCLFRGVPIGG